MNPRLARRIAAVALAFGVAVDLLFDPLALGINVPLTVAAALVAITLLRDRSRPLDRLDVWIPFVSLVAALGLALRTDPLVVLLDLQLAGLGVLAWALAVSVGGLTRRSVAGLAWLATSAAMVLGLGSLVVLPAAVGDGAVTRTASGVRGSLPVVRGLLLAVPIVAVFTVLLGSADAVFERLVADLLSVPFDVEDLVRRALIVATVAWAAGGGLLIAAAGLPWGLGASEPTAVPTDAALHRDAGSFGGGQPAAGVQPAAGAQPAAPLRPLVGATEMLTILVAVELLFAAFVVVQVAYLFGGFATVTAFGLTYSDYARQGFFQLVAVVVGAGLLLALASTVAARARWFAPLAVGLVALTAVILASAAARLGLYQQAYGWTELRFYVAAAIGWLALCLGVALAVVLARRLRWLLHGAAFAAIAVALAVTAIGPQAFVTAQNVARALDPALVPPEGKDGLDAEYVSTLGPGAIPILVEVLPRLDAATRATVLRGLERQRERLEADEAADAWPAWNVDRERAKAALEALPR